MTEQYGTQPAIHSTQQLREIVRRQLALDMNCDEQDFLNDGIVFREAAFREGRRKFERQTPYLEIATMGKGIVVCADARLLERIRPILEHRFREDVFAVPFVYGHSLYYIPEFESIKALPCPEGYTLRILEGEDVFELYCHPGFGNALQYDKHCARPDRIAVCGMKDSEIAGIAAASVDSATMWQIGIDVLPSFRNTGMASCLVSTLAMEILKRGIVPYYGTASSNIASQAVAHRSGFLPAWMCSYKNTLDGQSPYRLEISPEDFLPHGI